MRFGLVSSRAVSVVSPGRDNSPDVGTGPVGAIRSDHINNPAQQRAGAGFSNAEADYGPSDLGHIDQSINRRQYGGYKMTGRSAPRKSSWKWQWYDFTSRIPYAKDDFRQRDFRGKDSSQDRLDGPNGWEDDENSRRDRQPSVGSVTGTGWLARNRRGGA